MKAEWPKVSMNKLSFFLPCSNQLIALLPFAGIFFLYFSPKSEDLRLQIWNVPLWNTPVSTPGLYYMDFSCRIMPIGLDPRTWNTDLSMDLKKLSLMKAEWPKASMKKLSFSLPCCIE